MTKKTKECILKQVHEIHEYLSFIFSRKASQHINWHSNVDVINIVSDLSVLFHQIQQTFLHREIQEGIEDQEEKIKNKDTD